MCQKLICTSATGFGIARAASLGVVTSDLSCKFVTFTSADLPLISIDVYAVTAIWSNLELYLGIVGANLALGRSIYGYFFKEPSNSQVGSTYGYGHGSRLMTASNTLRVPSSGAFRSGRTNIASRNQDSEISLVETKKQQPSTWYADTNTDDDNPAGSTEHGRENRQ